MKTSADLSALMGVSNNYRRRDRKSIDRTKSYLNAYALSGDKSILEELNASFKGGRNPGMNWNLAKVIRTGV